MLGDAADLPFADGAFDCAVSVFGVIFAHPAERAATELARVVRASGRVAITTWPARGPMFGAVSLMRRAVAKVRGPDQHSPVDWGDPTVLERLLGPYGRLDVSERELPHRGLTPEEFWDRWERLHPMWIGARAILDLARPRIQGGGDGRKVIGGVSGDVGLFGKVLAQQSVGVLVVAALPRAVWIAEVDG